MKKSVLLDFSQFNGGLNTVDDPGRMPKNQVQDCLNLMLLGAGAKRRPGMAGRQAIETGTTPEQNVYTGKIWSAFEFVKSDGTTYPMVLRNDSLRSDGLARLSYINSDGTLTNIDSPSAISSLSKSSIKSFGGKGWITKGSVIKIEPSFTKTRLAGIPVPYNVTASIWSGGTLPDGVYKVIVGFYRKVDGLIVLYGVGYDCGSVTVGAGNNTVRVIVNYGGISNSYSDWSGVVVWMTDADGSVYYSYKASDATGNPMTIYVASNADRNASIVYSAVAANNNVPPVFSYGDFFKQRLWGVDATLTNRLWYSVQMGTIYDVEKFPDLNRVDFPFRILSIFGLGEHLYINTDGGLIRQPYGDPTLAYEYVDQRYHFTAVETLCFNRGYVIGITNDGIRIFDGHSFSGDIAAKIKNIYDTVVASIALSLISAVIVRKPLRTEYRLSYYDFTLKDVSAPAKCNRMLVLNIDTMDLISVPIAAAWELWSCGFDFMLFGIDSVFYGVQSDFISVTSIENTTTSNDSAMYDDTCTYQSGDIVNRAMISSHAEMTGIQARNQYQRVRALYKLAAAATLTVYVAGPAALSYPVQVGPGATP